MPDSQHSQGYPAPIVDEQPTGPEGPPPSAPAVVAVVVTHEPGPWFEEVLAAFAAQDYPALSMLFIDAASAESPSARIAPVLPAAYVRTLDANAGFGATANDVIDVVDGAAFYLICHDDVAPAPDAIRVMVEEAYRSNAGVVGPKLVDWDDTTRLLQVGLAADKTGVLHSLVERGELDQEQHDAVRDVFVVPGGCMLVRADLFDALGGYDPGIAFLGEDLDFCWRAHVAGARVLVAPAAVARHREALHERTPEGGSRRRLLARHRLRTMLTCDGPWRLARVLPVAAFLALAEILYALVVGRVGQARDIASAWPWNASRLAEIRVNRRRLRGLRQVRDSEVRRLQRRGSLRVAAFVRGQIGRGDDRLASMASAGRDLAGSLRSGPRRIALAGWMLAAAILLFGTRVLLTGRIPAVRELSAFPSSPLDLLRAWVSGWRTAGLGSESPAPTGYGLAGLAGLVLFGAMGLTRKLLILGLLPLGTAGAWRALRPSASLAARTVAMVAYVAIPVPYNAIAGGRWGGLAVWAAAPWLLRRLGRASGQPPFDESRPDRRRWQHVAVVGLVTALLAALVPFAVAVVLLAGLGLALGSVVAGRTPGSVAMLATAAGGVGVALLLHVPWTFDFLLPGSEWAAFGGVRSGSGALSLGQLLRFETGPLGAPPLGWAFLVAGALPLVVGREWRLAWAVQLWTLAACAWGLVWAGQQSWFPVGLGSPELLLALPAACLAMAAGLGVLAFELDLPGYRFGWRQAASVSAAIAVAAGLLPVVAASVNGRWQLPRGDLRASLSFLDDESGGEQFRVLWLGDPDVLPLAGWELDDGVAYATTNAGTADLRERWSGSSAGPTRLLADAVHLAVGRETSRLGRLLAPMAVRYVVVPEAVAPVPFSDELVPPPASLLAALGEQLDLEQVDTNPAVHVYRNAAWVPMRAVLPAPSIETSGEPFFPIANRSDLRASEPVLARAPGFARYEGRVPAGSDVFLAAAASSSWQLRVAGSTAERHRAFGWANGFTVDGGGAGVLRFRTSPLRYVMLGVQVLLWVLVLRLAWRHRTSRTRRSAR